MMSEPGLKELIAQPTRPPNISRRSDPIITFFFLFNRMVLNLLRLYLDCRVQSRRLAFPSKAPDTGQKNVEAHLTKRYEQQKSALTTIFVNSVIQYNYTVSQRAFNGP